MSFKDTITVLFLGDIIGKPGRRVVKQYIDQLNPLPDLIAANVENIAHGFGVAQQNIAELKECGVKVFSGGNHTFDRKEIFDFIDQEECLLRPANYPPQTPGHGFCYIQVGEHKVAFLNLMGRVFMQPLESPYMVADNLLGEISKQTNLIIVDFHAEATAEKVSLGWHLDGKVSAVLGTHTHVQTADERILPGGTAYLTDCGCCGPTDGIIGMERAGAFRRFIDQLPARLEVASGPAMAHGVLLTLNTETGKAVAIERVQFKESGDVA
jgi:metallophosphoesterase (TIGR00282 family)